MIQVAEGIDECTSLGILCIEGGTVLTEEAGCNICLLSPLRREWNESGGGVIVESD